MAVPGVATSRVTVVWWCLSYVLISMLYTRLSAASASASRGHSVGAPCRPAARTRRMSSVRPCEARARPTCFHSSSLTILQKLLRRSPEAPALTCVGLSYAWYDGLVRSTASRLRRRRIGTGLVCVTLTCSATCAKSSPVYVLPSIVLCTCTPLRCHLFISSCALFLPGLIALVQFK
jgi:hypothetical protein